MCNNLSSKRLFQMSCQGRYTPDSSLHPRLIVLFLRMGILAKEPLVLSRMIM